MKHPLTARDIKRFWSKVAKGEPTECWEWLGRLDKRGYGHFETMFRVARGEFVHYHHIASRLAWEITNGPVARGKMCCHVCDNRACCNPAHMFLGTAQDNMADMRAKGRAVPPPRLRQDGEHNPSAKITADDVRRIRARFNEGEHRRALADEYHLAPRTIRHILNRTRWAHIT